MDIWHCSKCGVYRDPQGLNYKTGKCWTCQEHEVLLITMNEYINIGIGDNVTVNNQHVGKVLDLYYKGEECMAEVGMLETGLVCRVSITQLTLANEP